MYLYSIYHHARYLFFSLDLYCGIDNNVECYGFWETCYKVIGVIYDTHQFIEILTKRTIYTLKRLVIVGYFRFNLLN